MKYEKMERCAIDANLAELDIKLAKAIDKPVWRHSAVRLTRRAKGAVTL